LGKGWTVQLASGDEIDPILTVPADYNYVKDVSCEFDVSPSLTGQATATDNEDPEVTLSYTDEVFNGECTCMINRTWIAEDNSGNTALGTQTIIYTDNTEPVMILPANYVDYSNNISGEDTIPLVTGQPTATDNCDDEVEISYTDEIVENENSTEITRIWKAEDECGNLVTGTQNITFNALDPSAESEPLKIIIEGNLMRVPLSEDYISWKAELTNFYGVLVLSKYVESDILEINISSLTPGVYLLVLSKDANMRVAKVYISKEDALM
jgi:hypothetical protein